MGREWFDWSWEWNWFDHSGNWEGFRVARGFSDGFDADCSFHFGPDAHFGQRVPDGTAWARLNEHLFTVAHDEALVAKSQWVNSFGVQARVRESLRAGQTIGTAFLKDTDVFQS